MKTDMLKEFADFRKKLKTEISTTDFIKSPTNRQLNLKQSFKEKLGLQPNIIGKLPKQQRIATAVKCITHSGLEKYENIRFQSQEDIACTTPKVKKIINITDRLMNYTSLIHFQQSLESLCENDITELPKEYVQQLEKLCATIQFKLKLGN